jgi:hypothetical protein
MSSSVSDGEGCAVPIVDNGRFTNLLARLPPEFLLEGKPLFPANKKVSNTDELFLYSMCLRVSQDEKLQFLGHYDKFGGAFKALKLGLVAAAENIADFNFFGVILPALQEAVLALPTAFGPQALLPVIRQNEHSTVSLSRSQVFILNAAAFLGLLGEPKNALCGEMNWMSVFTAASRTAGARVACQLAYFHKIVVFCGGLRGLRTQEDPVFMETARQRAADGEAPLRQSHVVFHRISRGSGVGPLPDWAALEDAVLLDPSVNQVLISHELRIEDFSSADALVDFANEQIHIGKIIASATQEEALFSMRPELFPAIILFETMLEHEVVLIHGARMLCECKGYGESFRFVKLLDDPLPHQSEHIPIIIVMDAHVNCGHQFRSAESDRDLNKAFTGFAFLKPGQPHLPLSAEGCEATVQWPTVATGNWGCGAFRGNPVLKFVQQLMAARVAKASLLYSTFGSQDLCRMLTSIAFKLTQHGVTVAAMHRWISEFYQLEEGCARRSALDEDNEFTLDFELFLLEKLLQYSKAPLFGR